MSTQKFLHDIFAAMTFVLFCTLPTPVQAVNSLGCDLFAAAVVTDTTYVVVGDRGKIFISKDAGKLFTPVASHTKLALASVSFPDAMQGWIVGQEGIILHTADGGDSWSPQSSGVDTYLMAVDFADAQNGCAIGQDSTVLTTMDGGNTWTSVNFTLTRDAGCAHNFFALKMLGPKTICITGDMGRVFLTNDTGQSWTEAPTKLFDKEIGEGRTLYALATSGNKLVAIGIDGTLITSADVGKTWNRGSSGTRDPDFFCLAMVDDFGISAGSGGNVIQTTNGGASWQIVKTPENVHKSWLSGIALKKNSAGEAAGLVVGQYGTVGIIRNSLITWL